MAAGPGLQADYRFFIGGGTNSFWYPLYSTIAEGLWAVSGRSLAVYATLHLIMISLIAPLTLLIALRLELGRAAAWLSACAASFLPYYVFIASNQPQVGITIVTLAATILTFVALYQGSAERRLLYWGAGLMTAAIWLLRPNAILIPVAAYVLIGVARPERRKSLLLSVGAAALLVPAFLAATGQKTPSNLAYNLYIGNNRHVAEYVRRYDILSLEDIVRDHGGRASPGAYLHDSLDFMRQNKALTVWHMVLKSARYFGWRLEDHDLNPPIKNLACSVPYLAGLVFGLFGAARLWRRGNTLALIVTVGTIVVYWLPHAVLFGAVRMRMTTEFLLLVLAAVGVDGSARAFGAFLERRRSPGSA